MEKKMFNIQRDTKIYVFCEACYATGGTEAIHQLVDQLRNLNHNAYVFYNTKTENPKPKVYDCYNTRHVFEIEDDSKNILIVPEGSIGEINKYKNIQKAIWWLSVNNVQKNIGVIGNKVNKRFSGIKKIPGLYKIYAWFYQFGNILFDFSDSKNKNVIHLAQSRYAENYLNKKTLSDLNESRYIYSLTDYLSEHHFKNKILKKENIVLYNPRKGYELTKKIIKYGEKEGIKFVALTGMTPQQVSVLMSKSKVYIDFGDHPGKDRMPREAAIKGCCVIVGLRGAADFYQDINILSKYKFSINLDKKAIIERIKDCFENYEKNIKDFEMYKRVINTNKTQFYLEVLQIFGENEKEKDNKKENAI